MRRHRPALATRVTAHQAVACEPHQAAARPARSTRPSAGGPTRRRQRGRIRPAPTQARAMHCSRASSQVGLLRARTSEAAAARARALLPARAPRG